jgi:hypothetical protein
MKKKIIISFLFVAISLLIGTYSEVFLGKEKINIANAAVPGATSQKVKGWMWADSVGWVSLSCLNLYDTVSECPIDYGVTQNSDGTWTGYGWNNNLGWLQFGICPEYVDGDQCAAKIDDGQLVGWARFLSADDSAGDWDGYISLSSTNDHESNSGVQVSEHSYGSTLSGFDITGYAWGDNPLGWFSVDAEIISTTPHIFLKPTLTTDSTPNGTSVVALSDSITVTNETSNIKLYWYKVAGAPNYTSCSVSADPTGTTWASANILPSSINLAPSTNPNGGTYTISSMSTGIQTYTLSCNYDGGTEVANARVIVAPKCFVNTSWGSNTYCPPGTPGYTTPGISWTSSYTSSCSAAWVSGPTSNNYTSGYKAVSGSQGSSYTLSCQHNIVPSATCVSTPLVLSFIDSSHPLYYSMCEPSSDKPQCSDGIDNDGDKKVDYPDDLQCYGPLDNSEAGINAIIKEE